MSRWSGLVDGADKRLEKDLEKEPTYAPGKPAPVSTRRVYFAAAYECQGCGGQNECNCGGEG